MAPATTTVSFAHVHVYCDALREVSEYKALERKLNAFASSARDALLPAPGREGADVEAGRAAWLALAAAHGDPVTGPRDPASWSDSRQDLVEQLVVGLGWRVTGASEAAGTRSVVVTTEDLDGARIIVTAHKEHTIDQLARQASQEVPGAPATAAEHFGGTANLVRFARLRNGRQGFAVLGFAVGPGGVAAVHAKYADLHPKLLVPGMPQEYDGVKVLEVYAYYQGEKGSDPDCGTLLRFIETQEGGGSGFWALPGFQKVEATFDGMSQPAYCDHWVNNVVSRQSFLETLRDTLGFLPKVDFNAGLVAAGEAQIESTVTGNEPTTKLTDGSAALRDQSQVYLPTNNALSEAGHVHLYLKEIGQGVQHIAKKVADLPSLVERANDFRKMTGAGFSFLSIPPSYYGSLTAKRLAKDAGLEPAAAERCIGALKDAGIVDKTDLVQLDTTLDKVMAALPEGVPREAVAQHVLRGRYNNMYELLRDHISEAMYLRIVRNQILVDVQGEDLLFQIFTSTILQRLPGEEAPFIEFIQRVCSERLDPVTGQPKPVKPGCGGFGIRNFLTLFLSIEVTKATRARAAAESAGDLEAAAHHARVEEAFTAQMEEANPVLTAISDAMTAEGEALERGDMAEAQRWAQEKDRRQEELQTLSSRYQAMMRELRQKAPVAAGGA